MDGQRFKEGKLALDGRQTPDIAVDIQTET
jgi:hypothetical protein